MGHIRRVAAIWSGGSASGKLLVVGEAVKAALGAETDWVVRSAGDSVKFGIMAGRRVGAVAVVSFEVAMLCMITVFRPLTQLLCFLGRQLEAVSVGFPHLYIGTASARTSRTCIYNVPFNAKHTSSPVMGSAAPFGGPSAQWRQRGGGGGGRNSQLR